MKKKEEDNGHRAAAAAVLSLDTFCQLLAGLYYTEATSQRVGEKKQRGCSSSRRRLYLPEQKKTRRRDEG